MKPELKIVRPTLDELAKDWMDTKAAEEALRDRRVRIECEMAEQMALKEEGATTEKTPHYKITATAKLTRSVDWDQFEKIKDQIPENLRPVCYKPELGTKGVKWLENNEPAIYRTLTQCISTKPAKTGFSISPLTEE